MRARDGKFPGIFIVGLIVSISNVLLFVSYYYAFMRQQHVAPPQVIRFFSMAAVFPNDFFYEFLSDMWPFHLYWILLMLLCSFGILIYNDFFRFVFILLNALHISVLGYIVITTMGDLSVFLEYFFRLYFNLVASGSYIAFVTMPEIRQRFQPDPGALGLKLSAKPGKGKVEKPRDAEGYYNLGVAYVALGRYLDAIEAYKKAVEFSPDAVLYQFALGSLCFERHYFDEAIAALKEVVRLDPLHLDAYLLLGRAYQKEGCYEQAHRSFEKASHVNVDREDAYLEMGKCCQALERFDEARECFRKVIELNKEAGEAYYLLGQILVNQAEQFLEARDVLIKAVKIQPRHIEAQYQLGMANIKLERYKDALRAFKEVVELDDNHKQAHYQLGFTYAMLKDFNSARREFQKLEILDPDLAANLAMLIK